MSEEVLRRPIWRHPEFARGSRDMPSRTLSALTGCEVFLKFENLQFTASFKERGALNTLLQLTDAEKKRGVIAMAVNSRRVPACTPSTSIDTSRCW